jgi:hypothetical protein
MYGGWIFLAGDVGPLARQFRARRSVDLDEPVLRLFGVLDGCQVTERAVWSAVIVIEPPQPVIRGSASPRRPSVV